jgi:hypothetical protein
MATPDVAGEVARTITHLNDSITKYQGNDKIVQRLTTVRNAFLETQRHIRSKDRSDTQYDSKKEPYGNLHLVQIHAAFYHFNNSQRLNLFAGADLRRRQKLKALFVFKKSTLKTLESTSTDFTARCRSRGAWW